MFKPTLPRILAASLMLGASLAQANPIFPGFDLFKTLPGTYVDLDGTGPMSPIPLKGVPFPSSIFAPGGHPVDTIVLRKNGLNTFPGNVDIELVSLHLESIGPVDLTPRGGPAGVDLHAIVNTPVEKMNSGGNNNGVCDLGETCQTIPGIPVTPPSPQGTMTVNHEFLDPDGDTFSASLPVLAQIILTIPGGDINNPADIVGTSTFTDVFTSTARWSHIPGPRDPHTAAYPAGGFYPVPGRSIIEQAPLARHIVTTSAARIVTTPEPASLALLGVGLGLLGWQRRRAA